MFIFILKLLVVAFFLVMFLRGAKLVWGIGLLTVTSALLLDTVLGTFGREEMVARLGFFFYVLSGGLFGGALLWLWGLLRPQLGGRWANAPAGRPRPIHHSANEIDLKGPANPAGDTAFDRQMLYQQVRYRLGPDDVMDLIFDLGINENDVVSPHEEISDIAIKLMDIAQERGQTGTLALAVERILTPLPPENLPRLEKLTADSPPTVLRQFLLAHYNLDELAQMAAALNVDWETLGSGNKKEMVRGLLLYLYRRNRLPELITLMQQPTPDSA